MSRDIRFVDHGNIREGKTRFGGTSSVAAPMYDTLEAYPGESLASITTRAYGSNTPRNRARITSANATLEGTINVPR